MLYVNFSKHFCYDLNCLNALPLKFEQSSPFIGSTPDSIAKWCVNTRGLESGRKRCFKQNFCEIHFSVFCVKTLQTRKQAKVEINRRIICFSLPILPILLKVYQALTIYVCLVIISLWNIERLDFILTRYVEKYGIYIYKNIMSNPRFVNQSKTSLHWFFFFFWIRNFISQQNILNFKILYLL